MGGDAIALKNIALNLDDRSRVAPVTAASAGLDLQLQADLKLGASHHHGAAEYSQ